MICNIDWQGFWQTMAVLFGGAMFACVPVWLYVRRCESKDYPSLLDQELREQKAENALLVYERGELVQKLEEFGKRCAMLDNENRILRQRVMALEDLAAVKDPVIKKCDEALEKLRRK